MGGYGSGWRRARTDVVEDCLVLSIADLIREGALVPGKITHGEWVWRNRPGDEPCAVISYEADLLYSDRGTLRLRYRVGEERQSYFMWLKTTVPPFGGRRWWFECPSTDTRVAKLYLPSGQTRFASRRAYGLAYSSSRKSRSKNNTLDVTLRYIAKMQERFRSRKPI
jgi:hypothetical protein